MKRPVIGLGAGGHARVLVEILRASEEWELAGLLDRDPALTHTRVGGVPVLGNDDLLSDLWQQGVQHAFLGIGAVRDTHARRALFERTKKLGFTFIPVIHPRAIVAPSAQAGEGAAILAGAIVNTDATLGVNVIINTGAIVEHDCRIGSHAHIASGACLAGGVLVGDGAFLGAGCTIRQGLTVGAEAVVGAGAVVIKDVPAGATVVGVPARVRT